MRTDSSAIFKRFNKIQPAANTRKIVQIFRGVVFRNYLWVTVLRQDLQHRRFSALNVSNKNQFASHHQRLRISSFLHGFLIAGLGSLSRFHRKYHSKPAQKDGKKPDACVMDGAPRRMRAVDLIEFATAALYTSEGQPMRAHTLHRLLLLHPATTTATLVCPQQGSRIDVSASQKNQRKAFNQKFSQTEVSGFLLILFSLHLRIMSLQFNPVIMFYWIILTFDVIFYRGVNPFHNLNSASVTF